VCLIEEFKSKFMNKVKVLILMLFVSTGLMAQEIEIPLEMNFENTDDYKNAEQLVLDASDWLLNTPLSEDSIKRKEVNSFLMRWMSGTPSVSIELVSGIVPLDCLDCLMSFMSGWTKYSLENDYSKDKINCALAGAEHAIEFYEKNQPELGKSSDMEKLIEQKENGTLKKYIQSQFKL